MKDPFLNDAAQIIIFLINFDSMMDGPLKMVILITFLSKYYVYSYTYWCYDSSNFYFYFMIF